LIEEVQEDFIKPDLGKDLLQFFVEAENLNDDEAAMLKLLKKATTYKTIKKAAEHYTVRFDHAGFTIVANGDSENSNTAGRSQADIPLFEQKINACERDAGTYMVKAKRAMYEYYSGGGGTPAFNLSYEAGPMVNYVDPATRTRGNENRKGFRF